MNKEAPPTSQRKELRDRIEAKRKDLEARLDRLKADGRQRARETGDRISSSLKQLKDTISGGWDNLSEETARRLNAWLRKAEELDKKEK